MASPCVAGTIALMFQAAPRRLRIEETHNLLLESAERVSIPGELPDRMGIGFLDVRAAVEAARKVGNTSGMYKQTTVQAVPAAKEVPAAQKPESHVEKAAEKAVEQEAVETSEMAPRSCRRQHSDLSSEAQDSRGDTTEAVSRFELAEDAPKTLDPDAPPKEIADALAAKNSTLALSLAIQAGVRDENELTNFIFFTKHPELPREKLDTKDPKYKQLSTEWGNILNHEVWKAIQAASENTSLVVSGAEVADHDRFFWGASGKKLKRLVEDAAKKVDLNPGLLGTIIMAETRRPQSYLSSETVSSYHIGVDDFYEMRGSIAAKVPAYAKVKWDRKQVPRVHLNDAKKPREVKTIDFDSGPDGVLATAVYLKYREVNLREIATKLNGDFDSLPVETRFALTRMVMAAGEGGATPYLKDALAGKDIFVRKNVAVEIYQTQRNATVRTAQAMHLSEWIFGISLGTKTQGDAVEAGESREAAGEATETLETHSCSCSCQGSAASREGQESQAAVREAGNRHAFAEDTPSSPRRALRLNTSPEFWFLDNRAIEVARADPRIPRSLKTFTSGNLVEPLIDGQEMMNALQGELAQTKRGDFFHYTAWRLQFDLELMPSVPPPAGVSTTKFSSLV